MPEITPTTVDQPKYTVTPVSYDPFQQKPEDVTLTPVDYDPFDPAREASSKRPNFQYNVGAWDKFINEMPNMPDALRKKANNAIAIAATHDIDPAQAMDLEPGFTAHYKNDNLGETAVKSFKRGLGNTYSSIGQTLKWAGMDGQVADDYVEYGERLKRAYLPPEPPKEFSFWRDIKDPVFWATRIPETLPTSLALIPAAVIGAYGGAGAGAMMGLGLFGRTILGAIGGAALSRPVESAFEAGGTYDDALAKGIPEVEARVMADSTYSRNLALGGLDAAQFALAFTPLRLAGSAATKTLSRRILASIGAVGAVALSEGGEERYQELIQVESLGGDASFFDFNDTRLNEATTIGAVFGLGMAGTGSVFKALTNEITKAMPPELKQTYDLEKTKALNAGSEEASAQIQALDVVAGIPDGKTHIEQVVADLKARAENTGNRAAEDVPGFAPPMDEVKVDTAIDDLVAGGDVTNEGISTFMKALDSVKEFNDNLGERGAIGKGWQADFPNVNVHSTIRKLTNHGAYEAAKTGDNVQAQMVIRDMANEQKVTDLAANHPDAIIVPVHAIEANGMNAIPGAFADYIGAKTGLEVNDSIVQTNVVGRTGKDKWHRLAFRPTFDGDVIEGRDYILVDDVVTGGGTFSELKDYIESKGGNVVRLVSLGAAQFSAKVAVSEKTKLALTEKYGKKELSSFLKDHVLHGGNVDALTESEARTILQAPSLDSARDRIAEKRAEAGGESQQGSLPKEVNVNTSILNNERGSMPLSTDSEIYQAILKAKDNIEEALPHLEDMGRRIYASGANTLEAWQAKMKEFLGQLWGNFKAHMADIWEAVKQFNEQMGQRGSIGGDIKNALSEEPLRKAIEEIKSQGGINLESLRHQRQKGEAKKAFASTYSQEQVTELTKKHPGLVSKKGKATLDEIADQHGFPGGDELLQALLGMESKAAVAKKAQGNMATQIRDDAALAKKGYEVGKGEIESYMLDLGDKLVIDGQEHVVAAIDKNDGTLTLKNGVSTQVAADDVVKYTAIRKSRIDAAEANEKRLRETRIAMAVTARADRNVKASIRRATGQYSEANMVREDAALREVLKQSAQSAQAAFRAGNAEGVATEKAKMKEALIKIKAINAEKIGMIMTERQKIQDRREFIVSLRNGLGLTDAEMKGLTKKNVLFMTDEEFNQFQGDLLLRAAELAKTKLAKMDLMNTILQKRLRKVENYREALKLPTIDKMTRAELEQFNELLKPFHDEDVFYTQRQLEMVDRTEKLKGTRTIREARAVLAGEYSRLTGKPIDANLLVPIHSDSLNVYRWDTVLSEQGPFFQVLVSRMTEAMLLADIRFRDVERKVTALARAAHQSRPRTIVERAVPQDTQIIEYLEAPPLHKAALAQSLTDEELGYAHYVQEYYGQALDYLIKTDALERGIRDYFNHTRRTFLETWKDDGLKVAFESIFENMRQDEAVFTILDGDTGNILPLEKFFANTLHRTGGLIPSKNLTRAFETYVKSFERKVSFDAIMDELVIFTDSLTPEGLTPRGLEVDRSLRTFVNQYINNKKGRHIGFDGALRQGGEIDSTLSGLKTFVTMLDLGLNIPLQLVNIVGEQVAQFIGIGAKQQAIGTARMLTKEGKAILEKYEAFTGISLWDKLTQPGKEVTGRLMDVVFAGYHVTTVASNKQFLLGTMTDDEFKNGELSVQRLAEMKLEMGRWRVTQGTASLVGSTSLGKAGTQYKTWAIVMGQRIKTDIVAVVKDLKTKPPGEALSTNEAREIYRIIGLASVVLIAGAASGADEGDDSYAGKLTSRIYREALSQMQSISPKLWLSTPRLAVWLTNLATNLTTLAMLEEYKNDHRLKGWEGLKKQFTPAPVRQLQNNRR